MEHARDEPLKGVGDLVGKIGARRENWGQAAASCENWMADPTSAPHDGSAPVSGLQHRRNKLLVFLRQLSEVFTIVAYQFFEQTATKWAVPHSDLRRHIKRYINVSGP